jgi:hypothetical protein
MAKVRSERPNGADDKALQNNSGRANISRDFNGLARIATAPFTAPLRG